MPGNRPSTLPTLLILAAICALAAAAHAQDQAQSQEKKYISYETAVAVTGFLPDSQGRAAGLKVDDIIVRYDGVRVWSTDDLIQAVKETNSESVEVEFMRGGEMKSITLKKGMIGIYIRKAIVEIYDPVT